MLRPEAISEAQTKFNDQLISILKSGPMWFEVGTAYRQPVFTLTITIQVGAEQYRILRREGKTPLPAPTIIESGIPFPIPSRDGGRQIPCRIMLPENSDHVKGVFAHIHGGGW